MNRSDARIFRHLSRDLWMRPLARVVGSVSLLAGMGALITVDTASAASNECAKFAKIESRTGTGFIMWNGKETNGVAEKFTGTQLTFGQHFYELHSLEIKINFGGDTYALGSNAVFDLGCSGLAVGQKAIMPKINLLVGSAKVKTTHAVEGSVLTEEGLFGQAPNTAAMSFSMTRVLSQNSALTLAEEIKWYQDTADQPKGVTDVKTLTGVLENVTPYVGPQRGTFRHVHSAKLTATSTFGHGTAIYHF